MKYSETLSSLNKLIETPIHETDPNEFARHLMQESDRSSIILCGSAIEDFLRVLLKEKMSELNGDEMKQLFRFEGPFGTFSNKIKVAHGVGLFDRAMRKKIEIIKAMRNAAAHSLNPVEFSNDPFKSGIVCLSTPENHEVVSSFSRIQLKYFFEISSMDIGRNLFDQEIMSEEKIIEFARSIKV